MQSDPTIDSQWLDKGPAFSEPWQAEGPRYSGSDCLPG